MKGPGKGVSVWGLKPRLRVRCRVHGPGARLSDAASNRSGTTAKRGCKFASAKP